MAHANRQTGWFLALVPLGLFAGFAAMAPAVLAGTPVRAAASWIPALGVRLSFHVDGLGLLFALLITGVGALVTVYAGGYLGAHPHRGRFYATLFAFMGSMLGLVLADNLVLLFVFWELTSLTSYLLIGFEHEDEAARDAALQALLVTGAGGLALLAGALLLARVAGTFELSALLGRGDAVRADPAYAAILVLVLLGAFTKSAQVPFHFWLPSAMAAPTPVSAYLHSATMVKAGVYLLARLSPVLGDTGAWRAGLTAVGAATLVVGAWLALRQTDLKRILAYTTVAALGALTALLGVGTTAAVTAAVVFLLGHALYKGALFLVAGAVDHETGARDAEGLRGLGRGMPITATAAAAAAVSMAGLPPTFGYLGKELLYEVAHDHVALAAVAVLGNVLYVAAAALVLRPFFGPAGGRAGPAEAPASLWIGPAVLAALGVVLGLAPAVARPLVAGAAGAVLARPVAPDLALWHGLTPAVALSALTLAGAAIAFRIRARLRGWALGGLPARLGPARGYAGALRALYAVAAAQTRVLQNGSLRWYLRVTLVVTIALAGWALLGRGAFAWPAAGPAATAFDVGLGALVLLAAFTATASTSRFAAVAALGAVGYGIAVVYALHGAPDLAMTQVVVDTLTVILFVLVFRHLPRFTALSSARTRVRDAVIAGAAGAFVTAAMWAAMTAGGPPPISGFFLEASVPGGHGRNVVNVILVDFRALDTMGEITVLALAALGVVALLRLGRGRPTGG
jgi:multicomponent Na+:H+ antiporter subunit A